MILGGYTNRISAYRTAEAMGCYVRIEPRRFGVIYLLVTTVREALRK